MPDTRCAVRLGASYLFLVLVLPNSVTAEVLAVRQDGSGDFTTIADAVVASAPNDTIEVGPGTYRESVFVDFSLRFVSTAGAASTRVDGEGSRRPFWFAGGLSVISGITLINGAADVGGAIRVDSATLRLRDCVLAANVASVSGGALYAQGATAQIDATSCKFADNQATHTGGAGHAAAGGRLTMSACLFYGNSAGDIAGGLSCADGIMESFDGVFAGNSGGLAGALHFLRTFGSVQRNTFYDNASALGATVAIDDSPTTNITRNIFSSDTGGFGIRYIEGPGAHSCNIFWDNEAGPIDPPPLSADELVADPLFCDPIAQDLTLSALSPASPAMSPCGLRIGALPVSCSSLPVEHRTWGGLKALYHR